MAVSVLQNTILLGFIYAIMALGIFLSFKVLNIPDLTVDGSFTSGCAVSAVLTVMGYPLLGMLLGFVVGMLAGVVSGVLQTHCKIPSVLAGILTMTALYSINLKIMNGMPNVSLFGKDTVITPLQHIFASNGALVLALGLVVLVTVLLYLFLQTQLGLSLRATGDNEAMVRASSINSDTMKILGLGLANGLVGLGGALFAQNQGFADVSGGIGMMVIGLASILVGEAFLHKRGIGWQLCSVLLGAIIYQLIMTFALQLGIASSDIKLLSAVLVAGAISLSQLKWKRRKQHA